ncbi:sigma-24 (FecI-like) [Jannaschia sp. CCS1]|nr:sigma-24 (FecI-like) [Jannaschia sp. CCS1]
MQKYFVSPPKDCRITPVLRYDMRMNVSDEDLALAAAGGDGAAYQLLLTRVYDRLFGLCFRLTGSRTEAEDLTQDICLALPGKLSGYRAQAKVTTWLYRVAVNAATDRRRRKASYTRATQGWGAWEVDRVQTAQEATAGARWLYRTMALLPTHLHDTLALVLDDVTHAEAAEILGVSEGTISWRVAEAKKKLREIKEREDA